MVRVLVCPRNGEPSKCAGLEEGELAHEPGPIVHRVEVLWNENDPRPRCEKHRVKLVEAKR